MDVSPKDVETARAFERLLSFLSNFLIEAKEFAKTAKNLVEEDPRRIVHGFKVGLAIVLVSLFYCLNPLYDSLGVSATWALLTVVVVFEYSVGATLGKAINRMIATSLAGFLGVGAYHLASLSGNNTTQFIILLFFCFIAASIVTFLRFFPDLKARHDYGLMIFILTFSLVTISGYRQDILNVASKRLSTIVIGCFIAISVCIFICPVWSGAELHRLVASNIDKLASFMDGFVDEYFHVPEDKKAKRENSFLFAHKSVLSTKSSEETMANLATWEPGHGQFRFRHPWKQYLKIGNLARRCAYKIDALGHYLNSDSLGFHPSSINIIFGGQEARDCIKERIKNLSSETGKVLKELSYGMKKMETLVSVETHIIATKAAAEELGHLLQSVGFRDGLNPLDLLHVATVVSLLVDIAACVEEVAEAVHELGVLARFKIIDVNDRALKDADMEEACPTISQV